MENKKIIIISSIAIILVVTFIVLLFVFRKKPVLTDSLTLVDSLDKYEWTYDIYDHNILELYSVDTEVEKKDDEEIRNLTFTFAGVKDGTTKIRFEYKNPKKENVKPRKTVIYQAKVEKKKVTLEKLEEKENLYNK